MRMRMRTGVRLSLVQMLSNISIAAGMLLIPKLAEELGASYLEVGLIGSCYGIALFLSSPLLFRSPSYAFWGAFVLECTPLP